MKLPNIKILDESNAQYRYKDELDTLIERKFDFTNPIRIYLTSAEVVELMNDKNYSSTKVTQTLAKMKVEQKQKKSLFLVVTATPYIGTPIEPFIYSAKNTSNVTLYGSPEK